LNKSSHDLQRCFFDKFSGPLKLKMKKQFAWLILVALLSACRPASQTSIASGTPTPAGQLTPYLTRTATLAVTPSKPGKTVSATALPSPSPTPRTYSIKQGDTVGGIALAYGVSVEAILVANPQLNPNLMVVGSTLVVPASPAAPAQSPAGDLPAATPLPVRLDGVHCAAVQDGGAWCFALAHNPQKSGVESVSATIRIADSNGKGMQSQAAFALLNLLPGKGTLPLAVYFPPPVPKTIQASAELLTALPVMSGSDRYLPASLDKVKTDILGDGLSANVNGVVTLGKGSDTAHQVWVLLIAYDASGQVVGLRRWEMAADQALKAGKQAPFAETVYSTGGKIAKATAMVEARP
jgi:LysM repeat protein